MFGSPSWPGRRCAEARTPADTVLAVLGIRDDSGMDPSDLLAQALRSSQMLLVLDNCEHLVDQAATLAARLLRAAPGLRILATSREPLMLAGEVVWAVPPLTPSSAVELFAMRAAASAPGFRLDDSNAQAVAGLCQRLDRVPLALELAATQSEPWAYTSFSNDSTTGSAPGHRASRRPTASADSPGCHRLELGTAHRSGTAGAAAARGSHR